MILGSSGQNIYPEEIEAFVNNQKFVSESVVVYRSGKLIALVYLDEKETKGMDAEALADVAEAICKSSNRLLPRYSQLSKVEIVKEPFEKTPKMSIKRFLYS